VKFRLAGGLGGSSGSGSFESSVSPLVLGVSVGRDEEVVAVLIGVLSAKVLRRLNSRRCASLVGEASFASWFGSRVDSMNSNGAQNGDGAKLESAENATVVHQETPLYSHWGMPSDADSPPTDIGLYSPPEHHARQE
jgi:hypothetical protein